MSDPWQWALVIFRALLYVGTAVAAGTALFGLLFSQQHDVTALRLSIALLGFSLLAALSAVAGVAIQATLLADGGFAGMFDLEMLTLLWQGPSGTALSLLAAGLSALILGSIASGLIARLISVAGVALCCAFFGAAGHTISDKSIVMPLIVGIHFACVCFWIGALQPLRHAANGALPLPAAAKLARHFGERAVLIVCVLIAAGVSLVWLLVGNPIHALGSAYGQLLLAKTGTVGLLLLLATVNKTRLVPGMQRGDSSAARAFVKSVNIEIALVVVIFIATASMTTSGSGPAAS